MDASERACARACCSQDAEPGLLVLDPGGRGRHSLDGLGQQVDCRAKGQRLKVRVRSDLRRCPSLSPVHRVEHAGGPSYFLIFGHFDFRANQNQMLK